MTCVRVLVERVRFCIILDLTKEDNNWLQTWSEMTKLFHVYTHAHIPLRCASRLASLSADAAGQLDVLGHDRHLNKKYANNHRLVHPLTRLAWMAQRLVSSKSETR